MSSEKFYDLLEQDGFVQTVHDVMAHITEQDERNDPVDLTYAIEHAFLHSETHEQYFIDLNEIETLKFKLFIAELIIGDHMGMRWYP